MSADTIRSYGSQPLFGRLNAVITFQRLSQSNDSAVGSSLEQRSAQLFEPAMRSGMAAQIGGSTEVV